MAEKKITPKRPTTQAAAKSEDQPAARVTKRRLISKRKMTSKRKFGHS